MAQSDPFDPSNVPAGPIADGPNTYCCDGLTYAEAAAMHTYPEAFAAESEVAPAPAPVAALPNTGTGIGTSSAGSAGESAVVALALVLALAGLWVARRQPRNDF